MPDYDHITNVTLKSMTPDEFKSRDEKWLINYGIHNCPFGEVFLATTKHGICHLIFLDQDQRQATIDQAIFEIQNRFLGADVQEDQKQTKRLVDQIFTAGKEKISVIVVGTNFQIKVWNALMKVPFGEVSTYGKIAKQIGNSKASRAVGSAVGANPISLIVPCHRVILSTGAIGNYRWGITRKQAMLNRESEIKNENSII